MPFTARAQDPGQYIFAGKQNLAAGISRAGQSIADALLKYQENKEERQFLEGTFTQLAPMAKDAGLLEPDMLAKFEAAGTSARRGIVSGLGARLKSYNEEQDRLQKEKFQTAQLEHLATQTELARRASDRQTEQNWIAADERQRLGTFNQRVAENPQVDVAGLRRIAAETGALTPQLAVDLERLAARDGGPVEPVERTYGDRRLLVNPRTGNVEADLTPKPGVGSSSPPPGMIATGATMNKDGEISMTFKPEGEGKALTQSEISQITALNQAEQDLGRLEKLYEGLGSNYGGPISGRALNLVGVGQNPNIAAIENAITAATPNLARGVFREVGVLTDEDIKRYKDLLPGPYDTARVRAVKIKQLHERIAQGKSETMKSLQSSGRDMTGFATEAGAGTQRFDSEAAARAGGAKTGDVIELYDPAKARWRKFQLD